MVCICGNCTTRFLGYANLIDLLCKFVFVHSGEYIVSHECKFQLVNNVCCRTSLIYLEAIRGLCTILRIHGRNNLYKSKLYKDDWLCVLEAMDLLKQQVPYKNIGNVVFNFTILNNIIILF